MYNVSRGPSRIINRTRRDINQKLETFDQIRELTRKNTDPDEGQQQQVPEQPDQQQVATMTKLEAGTLGKGASNHSAEPGIEPQSLATPGEHLTTRPSVSQITGDGQPGVSGYSRKRQRHEDQLKSSPRPVFQTVNNKGCRSTNGRGPSHEVISPQHEELIRFFNESWGRVLKEVEMSRQGGHDSRGSGIAYYQDKHVHPALQDFKPFDLEEWWGKRVYQNLTQ